MAYNKPWDEGEPTNATYVSDLDTVIQDLKEAVRERLEDVIPDFGNDAVQPKVLNADSVPSTATKRVNVTVLVDSIAASTTASIDFDTEEYDTADMWNVGSPSIITIPEDGVYLITGTVAFNDSTLSAGKRVVKLVRNRVGFGPKIMAGNTGGDASLVGSVLSFSWTGTLVDGDTINVTVYHNDASPMNIAAELAVTKVA